MEDEALSTPQRRKRALPSAQYTSSELNSAPHTDVASQIFPFMKLPAELRLHVYHMALTRNEPLLLHVNRVPDKSDKNSDTTTNTDVVLDGRQRDNPSLAFSAPPSDRRGRNPRQSAEHALPERAPLRDPIVPTILRLNKLIHKEARQVLYRDNVFTLGLISGVYTLGTLHQPTRSLIQHIVITVPSHHDILDGFADLVRLGLRYCWGLKVLKIILKADLPGTGREDGRLSGPMNVYANAFHILRWLPKGCSVVLEGNVSDVVRKVVAEEGRLQTVLDDVSDATWSC